MSWEKTYQQKTVSAQAALDVIKNGDRVFFGHCCSIPELLNKTFWERAKQWQDVTIVDSLSLTPMPLDDESYRGHVRVWPWFMGGVERKGVKNGLVDLSSMHLGMVPRFILEVAKPRVALLQVSEPDESGYMNFGPVGASVNKFARQAAEIVIAEVNKKVPYVYGEDNVIHVDDVDYIVEHDAPLPQLPNPPVTEVDKKIAAHIIDLIPDGATIQIGIGGIANAVAYGLESKRDLGAHTEMLTDSMVYLMKKGVINGKRKTQYPGKVVAAMCMGNQEMYDFIHRNPLIWSAPFTISNNPEEIGKNDNFISINGTLAVDLTGQAASEALGFQQYSSTGGQLDFVRGALRSKGGKSFLVMHSTVETNNGRESRIVLSHLPGGAITTPRTDIQNVVTEYGVVSLWGQPLRKRAELLISIAHPDFREQLTFDARKAGLL